MNFCADRNNKGMTLAEWINSALKRHGRTRADLAEALQRHPSQVTRLLATNRRPQFNEINTIEEFFGETIPDLWHEAEPVCSPAALPMDRDCAIAAISQMLSIVAKRGHPLSTHLAEEAAQLVLEALISEPEDNVESRTPDIVRSYISGAAVGLFRSRAGEN